MGWPLRDIPYLMGLFWGGLLLFLISYLLLGIGAVHAQVLSFVLSGLGWILLRHRRNWALRDALALEIMWLFLAASLGGAVMSYLIKIHGDWPSMAPPMGIGVSAVALVVPLSLFHRGGDKPIELLGLPLGSWWVWGAVGMLTLVRLLYAGAIPLIPEEAYYWDYSVHPSLSYLDHPPMVAWIIRLGTTILGNNELGVRAGFLALGIGSSWLLYKLGSIWFGPEVGLGSALVFNLLPFTFGSSLVAMTEGPLFFFWLLSMVSFSLAVTRGQVMWWYAAGAALGGAMLSKYTAVFIPVSLLTFLLLSPRYRTWLMRKEPYLAVFISLFLFSPVLIWNARNHWASLVFQSTGRLHNVEAPSPWDFLRYTGAQMAVHTPLVYIGMVMALWVGAREAIRGRSNGAAFCSIMALPCLAAFSAYGFTSWVKINWPAPAYLALIPAGIALYLKAERTQRSDRWKRAFIMGLKATPLVCILLLLTAAYHLAIGIQGAAVSPRLQGWRGLARGASRLMQGFAESGANRPFFLGMDKNTIASELAFYAKEPMDVFSQDLVGANGVGYAFWSDPKLLEGRDALAVIDVRDSRKIKLLRLHFEHLGRPRILTVHWAGREVGSYLLVPCMTYHSHRIRRKRSQKPSTSWILKGGKGPFYSGGRGQWR